MSLSKFPRFPLAHLPTPLEPLDRLRRHLARDGMCPRLYIKRDDCTGLALGGNKTRKAEFLIGDALRRRRDRGDHRRRAAIEPRPADRGRRGEGRARLPPGAEPQRADRQPRSTRRTATCCSIACWARPCMCARPGETRADAIARLLPALKKDGVVPYVIPTGGSNEIGALGYAAAAMELQQQAKEAGIAIDRVLFATASGGTQAGLVAGMALAERRHAGARHRRRERGRTRCWPRCAGSRRRARRTSA